MIRTRMSRRGLSKAVMFGGISILAISIALPAMAQSTTAPRGGLEEIVVTARPNLF